jgi:hypothetical protein
MTEPLDGLQLRVFRSLEREWDRDTVEAIRVELTRGPAAGSEQIEQALSQLEALGYVEEREPGRWAITPNGLAVKGSLTGVRT